MAGARTYTSSPAALQALHDWIDHQAKNPQTLVRDDTLVEAPMQLLASTFHFGGRSARLSPIHPAWHWLFFHSLTPNCDLDEDGYHGAPWTPPAPFRLRLFGGGDITYHPGAEDVRFGARLRRVSTLKSRPKARQGKHGMLALVTVEHKISEAGSGKLLVTDVQNFVYRDQDDPTSVAGPAAASAPSAPAASAAPPPAADLSLPPVTLDEVMLFRFSSLTWNSHRIHYQQDWAKKEGYPGPLVHGPLQASLLLDLVHRGLEASPAPARLSAFKYRALRPLVCNTPALFFGKKAPGQAEGAEVWSLASHYQGVNHMEATAHIEKLG